MSDNFVVNEDFEKVDADQDENITSTSLPGESPEEDRYSGSPAQNTADALSDFLSGGGPASYEATADPLISFGSSSPEPFATESTPTQQTVDSVSVVTPSCQSEGNGSCTRIVKFYLLIIMCSKHTCIKTVQKGKFSLSLHISVNALEVCLLSFVNYDKNSKLTHLFSGYCDDIFYDIQAFPRALEFVHPDCRDALNHRARHLQFL